MPAPATDAPSCLPLLQSVNRRPCAKVLSLQEGRVAVSAGYGKERRWRIKRYDVPTFDDLAATLEIVSQRDDVIVVRGHYSPTDPDAYDPDLGVLRRTKDSPHGGGHFIDVPRTWIPVDVDGCPVDDKGATEATLCALVDRFPEPFRDRSFWYQFTSQHNIAGEGRQVVRVRLWFHSETPVSSQAILTCFAGRLADLRIDPCVWRAVQPVYIARPLLDGIDDPLPDRTGIVRGFSGDAVGDLPEPDADTLTLAAHDIVAGIAPGHSVEIANARQRILQSETDGARHLHAVGAAVELLTLGAPPDETADVVDLLIRQQGRDPETREVAGILAWAAARVRSGAAVVDRAPSAARLPDEDDGSDPEPDDGAELSVAAGEQIPHPDADDDPTDDDDFAPPYSQNTTANATVYLRAHHEFPPTADGDRTHGQAHTPYLFVRYSETDYEWDGRRYHTLEPEELEGRVQRRVGVAVMGTAQAIRRCAVQPTPRDSRYGARVPLPFWRWPEKDDPDPQMLIPFRNGVLDLAAWLRDPRTPLRPHDPRLFVGSCLPYDYDPTARAPHFDAWVQGTFADNESRVELRKLLGYCFLPTNPFHRLFVLSGAPRSGKGVTQRLIQDLLGPEACTGATLTGLGQQFGLENLIGKRVAIIGEANTYRRSAALDFATDRLKAISGGDAVDVDRKNRSAPSLTLGTRFVLACNTFPAFLDPSGALLDRLSVLRYETSHAGREDRMLEPRLRTEMPGIAWRALEGLRAAMKDGFQNPPSVREYIQEIRGVLSPVSAFLDDCILMEPTAPAAFVALDALFGAYVAWCAAHKARPIPRERFTTDIRAVMPQIHTARPRIDGRRVRGLEGPGLMLSDEGEAFARGDAQAFPVVDVD